MKTSTSLFLALILLLASTVPACTGGTETSPEATGPSVTLSMDRAPAKAWVEVRGTGFTPNANVTSHLLQPDGREFPYLPILTDANGEFAHEVDTLLLLVGTHELWVEDDRTGVSSNVARFEVTREQDSGQ
jgi:hypothetical protein